MELFLDITGKDNEDILLSSLIPLRARCYFEYCVAAKKCMKLAGACTAKTGTAANRALTTMSELEGSEMSVVAGVFWQKG